MLKIRNFLALPALLFIAGVVFSSTEISAQIQKAISAPEKQGILLVSETTYFSREGNRMSRMTIMKEGEKMRIEETIPLPLLDLPYGWEEAKTITISDGDQAWLISPISEKKQKVNLMSGHLCLQCFEQKGPIGGQMGTLNGKNVRIVERGKERWYIDEANRVPLRKERGKQITSYKDYQLIKGLGFFPKRMEISEDGNLTMKTVLKEVDTNRGFPDDVFDPDKVEFSGRGKEIAQKHLPLLLD